MLTPMVAFVCSLLQAGVQPTLDPSAETFMSVQCARGEGGLNWGRAACWVFLSVVPLGVAYCLAKRGLTLLQRQPLDLPRLSALAHVSAANSLTLLIKASAMVTVYSGHRRTLFPIRD